MGRHFLLLLLALGIGFGSHAQKTWRDNSYLLAKVGYGVTYAGLGGVSVSYGRNLLSGYLSAGVVPSLAANDSITVPGSFNVGFGARYHLPSQSEHFRARFGAHFGWLDNYYHDNIGSDAYEPIVYGALVSLGAEYFGRVLSVEVDASLQPDFLVVGLDNHPFYGGKLSVSAGVGFNLFSLRGKERQTWQQQYEHGQFSPCFTKFDQPFMPQKGCTDKVMAWQQADSAYTLVVRFDPTQFKLSPTCQSEEFSEASKIEVCLVRHFEEGQVLSDDPGSLADKLLSSYDANDIWVLNEAEIVYIANRKDVDTTTEPWRFTVQVKKARFRHLSNAEEVTESRTLAIWNVKVP